MGLTHDISTIKHRYRELFQLAHNRLESLFDDLKMNHHCLECSTPPVSVESVLHPGCGYLQWQKKSIIALEQGIGKQVLESLERVKQAREEQGQCHQCGVCCSFASSEFSETELREKAQQGNWFAQQFTSVFLPYDSIDAAQARYPHLANEIAEQSEGDVYFYYCPHLTEDNLCGLYGNPRRPQICADYPETPLILMYKGCGYQPWKEDMLPTTLLAHATLELCQYYAHKILEAVKSVPNDPVSFPSASD